MSVETNRIKTEPLESSDELAEGTAEADFTYRMARNDQLLNMTLHKLKDSNGRYTKPASSPAQEAAKARIRVCELHLRALYKKQGGPDEEDNDLEKIRKVEDDLKKAHARLKRLTNEAQRQRRRRERLRMGLPPSSPSVLGVSKELKFLSNENGESVSSPTTNILLMPRAKDRAIMGVLRKCGNFEDLARELRTQGFMICQTANICGTIQDENNFIYEGGSKIDSASPDENNPDLEVEDNPAAVLEQSMSFEEDENNNINEVELIIQPQPEILEIKSEPTLADCSVEDDDQELAKDNGAAKLEFSINDSPLLTNEETAASTSGSDPPSKQNITDMVKIFAETYAVRHSSQLREWQEQYQVWFQRQLESQQQWQEMFMREQIEQTRSMVQNVTTTFLQEMQQLLQNVITNVSHRPMVPFIPSISRNSECVFSVVPNTAGTM